MRRCVCVPRCTILMYINSRDKFLESNYPTVAEGKFMAAHILFSIRLSVVPKRIDIGFAAKGKKNVGSHFWNLEFPRDYAGARVLQWPRRMKLKTIIAGNFRTCLEQHNSAAAATAPDNEIRLHCFQFLWHRQRQRSWWKRALARARWECDFIVASVNREWRVNVAHGMHSTVAEAYFSLLFSYFFSI